MARERPWEFCKIWTLSSTSTKKSRWQSTWPWRKSKSRRCSCRNSTASWLRCRRLGCANSCRTHWLNWQWKMNGVRSLSNSSRIARILSSYPSMKGRCRWCSRTGHPPWTIFLCQCATALHVFAALGTLKSMTRLSTLTKKSKRCTSSLKAMQSFSATSFRARNLTESWFRFGRSRKTSQCCLKKRTLVTSSKWAPSY